MITYVKHLLYLIKFEICYRLGRFNDDCELDPRQHTYVVWEHSGVSPGSPIHPTIYWHEWSGVGYGLFRDWWCVVRSDASD